MTAEATLFLISGLVSASVASIWIALRSPRDTISIRKRFRQYVDTPLTAEDLELQQPFYERVIQPWFRQTIQRLGRLTPMGNLEEIARQLTIAGNPGDLSPIDFIGLRLLAGLCLGGLAAFYAITLRTPPSQIILYGALGALLGLFLPKIWLNNRIKKRKKAITKALPDALDMLTICVDAGLGFDAAMLKVSQRWDNPLGQEFARVVSEMRMGIRRADALRHMAERTDVPEIHAFVAVLVQADRLGVSITDILHTQSEQLRTRRRQWAEEQARKAPVKMLFPMILFIFPALFIVILGPAVPRFLEALASMR
ncbi:MAG TPA: type II secretion system F family protein [Caldilineae bacterium]|nr:type II secretion system F family protein [Caldilineae bacterium]